MKIVSNVTLFVCDFCKKKLVRKHAMEKHEVNCYANPANQSACSGCHFLKETTNTVYWDTGYGEESKVCKSFKCEKLEKVLYPFKVVRKGLLEKHPETFVDQELMPNKCEHYQFFTH